ncbi:MAG: NTP/NDP exchange transporter [Beijerinckiaceae bacterium]
MAVTGWLKARLDTAGIASDAERGAVVWSFLYFFCLLASYFILRPLRDEMGVAAGRDMLQYLFTATFAVMLVAAPLYAFVWSRLPRRLFIPLVYHFFVANLLVFWLLLYFGADRTLVARVFFVWVSVFNLFAVSVFWSFLADIFRTDQGKRLYGLIAAGGTAGTWLGSSITVGLTHFTGVLNLLLVAGLLLEVAVFCARRLEASAAGFRPAPAAAAQSTPPDASPGANSRLQAFGAVFRDMLAGFRLVLSSPYLAGIAAWVALLSLAGTFLYFVQRDVVAAASPDPAVRTQIFAGIDLAANVLTLLIQAFVTGKLIERMGTGISAAVLPLAFAIGFAALAVSPVLAVIVGFQVLQRTANFAVSNPAREIFFTAVDREEKYKAKNVIDTTVFRGGDVVFAWLFAGLRSLGLGVPAIAVATVPVALAWAGLSVWLGREQEKRVSQNAPQGGNVSNGG